MSLYVNALLRDFYLKKTQTTNFKHSHLVRRLPFLAGEPILHMRNFEGDE